MICIQIKLFTVCLCGRDGWCWIPPGLSCRSFKQHADHLLFSRGMTKPILWRFLLRFPACTHNQTHQSCSRVPIRVGNRKSIPESDTSGQESDTCCQIQFSIPPIDSYALFFLFICDDWRESNERGKGTPAKWASAEQWDAVRLYVSKTIFPVLSAVTVLTAHALITSS